MNKLANFFSIITHPILLPTWLLLIITEIGLFKTSSINASMCIIIVSAITFVIPTIIMLFLKKFKVIKTLSMERRDDRVIPILIMATSLYITSRFFNGIYVLGIYNFYLICSTLLCMIVFWVNLFWKISLHSIGWGGFVGILYIYTTILAEIFLPYFIISIIVAGIVCSARLYLKSHDSAQIYVGFITGFMVTTILYRLLIM